MGGDMDTCLFNKRLTEISFLWLYSNRFRRRRTQGAGQPRSHHVNNLYRSNCLRMRLPGKNQHCSILFKSGVYGGKYNNLHPTL